MDKQNYSKSISSDQMSTFGIYQTPYAIVEQYPKPVHPNRRLLYILLSIICAIISAIMFVLAVILIVGLVNSQRSEWIDYNKLADNEIIEDGPFTTECGRTYFVPSMVPGSVGSRIINGVEAVDHSFPWIVSLRKMVDNRIFDHFCAGSIISEDTILTAAHCIDSQDIDFKQVVVVTGSRL